MQQYQEIDIQQAVWFILSNFNIQRISWDTKKVIIDGKEIKIPCLLWKKIIPYIFRDYVETVPKDQQLRDRSFYKLVKVLIAADQRAKKAFYYMSSILMHDNVEWI